MAGGIMKSNGERNGSRPPKNELLTKLGIDHPIIQAPMAGGTNTLERTGNGLVDLALSRVREREMFQ